MDAKHPIQPLVTDEHGVVRFKANAIVRHLLEHGGIDLNKLAMLNFTQEDWEQFAQLIGYSLSGFGELSYVSDETYSAAYNMQNGTLASEQARIKALEDTLDRVRTGLRAAAVAAFHIHPDDLHE